MDEKRNVEDRFDDIIFDDFSTVDEESCVSELNVGESAVLGANAAMAGIQTTALQEAIEQYAQALNASAIAQSTGLPVRTPSAQYKGFAAEEYFKQTLKINALAKGIPDWQLGAYTRGAMPDGSTLSGIDMETDIAVFTRKNPWSAAERVANFQSKMHDDPTKYAQDMANAQYEKVDFVGGAGQGVNDTVSVEVGGKTVSSDSITPEEAKRLAEQMKEQNAPNYERGAEKHTELHQVKAARAAAMGAAAGVVLMAVKEVIHVIRERDDLPEDQWVQSVQNILCGGIEGGVRGGAIAESVWLLGKAVGKELAESSLEAVPAMAIANASVDLAKDLYRLFVSQTIDADDLLCNTVEHTFSSFAGFGGSWLGGQAAGYAMSAQTAASVGASIGSALGPIGTVVGAAIGGLLIGYGASRIVGTAAKDAQKAFEQCISDINKQVELTGCDRLYYFADAMSELSEFRLSFKNLLPCYNLISDLKEYNLRKKAIKNVRAQMTASLTEVDASKQRALESLEKQHAARLAALEGCFKEQRDRMYRQFEDSLDAYVSDSYARYVGETAQCRVETAALLAQLERSSAQYDAMLERLRSRNEVNAQINAMLSELMSDADTADLVKPFADRLYREMRRDELVLNKQYLSFEEAKALQGGLSDERVG